MYMWALANCYGSFVGSSLFLHRYAYYLITATVNILATTMQLLPFLQTQYNTLSFSHFFIGRVQLLQE